MSSIKVAVRVRPFNKREKEQNSKLIIKMDDKTTNITDPVSYKSLQPNSTAIPRAKPPVGCNSIFHNII